MLSGAINLMLWGRQVVTVDIMPSGFLGERSFSKRESIDVYLGLYCLQLHVLYDFQSPCTRSFAILHHLESTCVKALLLRRIFKPASPPPRKTQGNIISWTSLG